MLDRALLERTRLHARPLGQRLIAHGFLRFDYRRIELVVEGDGHIPATPVVYAMNHTDDFNYWPFQYHLLTKLRRYTATWVKGKNYEHPVVRTFMRATNNIPIPSRGYLITRDFMRSVGRRPTEEEYRIAGPLPDALVRCKRDMLGRPFDPKKERYVDALEALFLEMMDRFVALNEEALRLGLDLLVFPQGSRSKRLSRGFPGLAQMALHLKTPIVAVGCSGSDVIYPTRSPVCSPGRVVYRVGAPIAAHDLERFAVPAGTRPFDRAGETANRGRYQALVDHVMDRINDLVDEPYRFVEGERSDGTAGTDRFV
jgi:1-acyl-sn-glycerol-3-phosphate acyltransferase